MCDTLPVEALTPGPLQGGTTVPVCTVFLLRVPVANPDLYSGTLQRIFELLKVRPHGVVGIRDLRLECLDALRCLRRRHRVRQVHRYERYVDILERLHLRDALGVACEVQTFAADIHDVTVAPSLRVAQLPVGCTAPQVILRHDLNGAATDGLRLPAGRPGG